MASLQRDWIAEGRRPLGLCGAAIFMAASFEGCNRTIQEVANVV